jgi:hypothetical protein
MAVLALRHCPLRFHFLLPTAAEDVEGEAFADEDRHGREKEIFPVICSCFPCYSEIVSLFGSINGFGISYYPLTRSSMGRLLGLRLFGSAFWAFCFSRASCLRKN